MTGIGAVLTAMFCIAVAALPRGQAAVAFLGATLFITQGQSIDIGGVNCMAIRFVEVFAFARVVIRGEFSIVRRVAMDRWLLCFFIVSEALLMFRSGEIDKTGIGYAADAFLVYFSFRAMITSSEEYTSFLKGVSVLFLPFTVFMVIEANTGRNLFALMGGVGEFSELRDGHYRCNGSFRHSITVGSLGATFLPLFVSFVIDRYNRRWALLGFALSFIIVITSRSSGPLLAMTATIVAWVCWPLRRKMWIVRRGIVGLLLALHLVMKQPVWFIFDRISGFIGGDGWHRSNLIDKFILHFDKWWFWGMPIEDTGDWAATKMPWGGVDVTNYYVAIGITGGLISLVIFIALLTSCFRLVGGALDRIRDQNMGQKPDLEYVVWGIGCAVSGHVVNYTAVLYWDQSYVVWYLHIAIAASLSSYCLNRPSDPVICLVPAELATPPRGDTHCAINKCAGAPEAPPL